MSSPTPSVERALTEVQRLIRRPPSAESGPPASTRQLPVDVTNGHVQHLGLLRDEVHAIEAAAGALIADRRFEHLRDADGEVWRFAAHCWSERDIDHVPVFIEKHGQEPTDIMCYYPVEFLTVASEMDVFGVRLLPSDDTRVPDSEPWFSLEQHVGCVAAVGVSGTNHELMAERGLEQVGHALRLLRIALRAHPGINYRQLRFRVGTGYAFDARVSGWAQRDDTAYDLTVNDELAKLARNEPIAILPVHPSTDIEKKADVALRWMERAWLTGEPLVALLYLFFALEALLGDKSEGLKAHGLAFRQAMLSHISTGGFSHPNKTWFLYDEVRSGAVHGENQPDVSWEIVRGFAEGVHQSLNQYITLTQERKWVKRRRLLRELDRHTDKTKLIDWLRTNGGQTWTRYLATIDPRNSETGGSHRESQSQSV